MSTAAATPEATTNATSESDDQFAAIPCEYAVEKRPTGEVVVKDVPVFGENERKSFAGDAKYDELWLKRAAKIDDDLRKGDYRAPMHFGHHTFSGAPVDSAGHYELTGVRKVKLHGKKLHVAFANLVFKNEAKFERYRSEYPYRSVEISHERPDQINSLALLSAEAPFFQFPMGNLKFGTDVGTETPKAHYFTWRADGLEQFAGFPPKKGAATASKPPKFGEDQEAAGQSDGADGMAAEDGGAAPAAPTDAGTNQNDVVVKQIDAMMELLVKLVDHVITKDKGGADAQPTHQEPDGDEPDGDEDMKDQDNKDKKPIVSASADVAVAQMQGTIEALQAKIAKMEKDAADAALFASLRAELAPYGVVDLDAKLREHVEKGSATEWAAGIKLVAPTRKPEDRPSENAPPQDAGVTEFLKKHPKADPDHVRYLASVYASAPEDTPEGALVRKWPLEQFLEVQIEMGV